MVYEYIAMGSGRANSIFISYSRKDKDLVIPVIKAQEELQRTAFIDYDDTDAGADWEDEHSRRIGKAERLVLCWSKDSAASPNVEREWRLALEHTTLIIPVLLDDTPLHFDLSHIHALDMRDYVRLNCGPVPLETGIRGAIFIGVGLTIFAFQAYAISDRGFTAGRLLFAILSGVLAYVGWRKLRRWKDWLRFKNFVDRSVIRDIRQGNKTRIDALP
jgi:TIR domain